MAINSCWLNEYPTSSGVGHSGLYSICTHTPGDQIAADLRILSKIPKPEGHVTSSVYGLFSPEDLLKIYNAIGKVLIEEGVL